ncbi:MULTISPECIES: hypothetical protein [unclassified Treponema]|uniref:hypothetical protein n=1 Tax=unclassified Treponema TaxID=2638727 RepID=UPI0020A52DC8|nr:MULTISPECIES: hypothetical protein [unclassified Treponema]
MNSKIACGKINTEYALKTDRWLNHKDVELLLPYLKKIGKIKLAPYKLWTLSPAHTLQNFYDEIISDTKIYKLKLMDTCKLVESILEE